VWLAGELDALEQAASPTLVRDLVLHSIRLRESCEHLVKQLDELRAAGPMPGGRVRVVQADKGHKEETQTCHDHQPREGLGADGDDEDLSEDEGAEILDRYRLPSTRRLGQRGHGLK
jgi:hypothetical protein